MHDSTSLVISPCKPNHMVTSGKHGRCLTIWQFVVAFFKYVIQMQSLDKSKCNASPHKSLVFGHRDICNCSAQQIVILPFVMWVTMVQRLAILLHRNHPTIRNRKHSNLFFASRKFHRGYVLISRGPCSSEIARPELTCNSLSIPFSQDGNSHHCGLSRRTTVAPLYPKTYEKGVTQNCSRSSFASVLIDSSPATCFFTADTDYAT